MDWLVFYILVMSSTKSKSVSRAGRPSLVESMHEWHALGYHCYHNPCCKSCAGPDNILAESSVKALIVIAAISDRRQPHVRQLGAWKRISNSALPCALKMLLSTVLSAERSTRELLDWLSDGGTGTYTRETRLDGRGA